MASKAPAKKAKDLTPKWGGRVKGGKLAGNDNWTLVRGAKPTPKQKDLPAKPTTVKGGWAGWTQNDNTTLVRASKTGKKTKDLAPKSGSVKGGRAGENLNDNMTLVRNATPAPKKRDLPSRKDVKGGKKRT